MEKDLRSHGQVHSVWIVPEGMEISPSKRWSIFLSGNWHSVSILLSSKWLYLSSFLGRFLSLFLEQIFFFNLEHGSACSHFKYFTSYPFVCPPLPTTHTHNRRHLASFKKTGWGHFQMLCVAGAPLPPSTRRCAVRYGVVRPTERAMAKPFYSCGIVVTQ